MKQKSVCIVDFDKTLIFIDSLFHIMLHERWFLSPTIFLNCILIIVLKLLRKNQLKARSRVKRKILQYYYDLPELKKGKYIALFKSCINQPLINSIIDAKFDSIIVVSGSEYGLIKSVLEGILGDIHIIANQLSKDKDFETCYGTNKLKYLKKDYPCISEYMISVYTDSYSDQPLMDLAQESWLVDGKDIIRIK